MRHRAYRAEDFFQSIRRMRIIHQNGDPQIIRHLFQSAGHRVKLSDSLGDGVRVESQSQADTGRSHDILQIRRADEG